MWFPLEESNRVFVRCLLILNKFKKGFYSARAELWGFRLPMRQTFEAPRSLLFWLGLAMPMKQVGTAFEVD